ncbi:MAG: N-6 DNA methylase [Defluviitaleaceae bacterium]|nr:N-6 DNA methylase [Defluviitaleaceae bacterium]
MDLFLDYLRNRVTLTNDNIELKNFYESVHRRVAGIDNYEGKQKIIKELYETFFKTAFKKMTEQLGIVYTPIEVIDFIIHSVADVLQAEFDRDISDENVTILDPFTTGTGTFITRLLQSGRIRKEDLPRKYKNEIFANEIVLLAYYIAAVNIENVYYDIMQNQDSGGDYVPFKGIALTDIFKSHEKQQDINGLLIENTDRIKRANEQTITIIFGNPPYSVGQKVKKMQTTTPKIKNIQT